LFKGLQRQRRRNIKRARDAGIETQVAASREALFDVFYPLHVRTRQRLGVPVQPRRFFEVLWRRLIEPGLGTVVTAHHEGTPVAAGVLLAWNRYVTIKYSGSDRAYSNIRPTDALFAACLRWSVEQGAAAFDMGRTELENPSLREFKQGWRGEERELSYSHFADAPPEPGSGRAVRALGVVLRRSPPFVTRAVGELAYKYAA
jgi:lipid II:glycine glycyltransferase (peptidoglycan interpeptide bridge formation enzyme)